MPMTLVTVMSRTSVFILMRLATDLYLMSHVLRFGMLWHIMVCRGTLQYASTHRDIPRHISPSDTRMSAPDATQFNALQHTAISDSQIPPVPIHTTLQHATTRCNLHESTATRSTLQHPLPSDCTMPLLSYPPFPIFFWFAVVSTDGARCSVMQYAATRCSVPPALCLLACELMVRQFAIHIHTLLHPATHRNPSQHAVTR